MKMIAALIVFAGTLATTSEAVACTLCQSRVAEDVRTTLFGPDFWWNIGALFSPAPFLMIAVLFLNKVSPFGRRL
jgi:hypothetical protein